MEDLLLIVVAYGITFLESVVQMKAWTAFIDKKRNATANWDALFDLILFADMYLVYHQWWLVFPIVIASRHGSWYAFPYRQRPDGDNDAT